MRLGNSGLVSSVIGLGGGSSGRFGLKKGGTRSDAIRLIHAALDQGITLFDGAGICGGVDELLAEGLAERRQDVVLSTKVHLGPDPVSLTNFLLPNRASSWIARRAGLVCSASTVRKRVERSLKALRTDRIDILHVHAVCSRQYPLAAARILPELVKMKEEGKLRAIGMTEGFLADPAHSMLGAAVGNASIDTIMVGFNVRNPTAAEFVIPAANEAGIGVIGMFVVRGLLRHAGEMTPILEETGIATLSELAFRYCRHQPGMHVVLTGTGSRLHLKQNIVAALAPALPTPVLDRLRTLSNSQTDGASTR